MDLGIPNFSDPKTEFTKIVWSSALFNWTKLPMGYMMVYPLVSELENHHFWIGKSTINYQHLSTIKGPFNSYVTNYQKVSESWNSPRLDPPVATSPWHGKDGWFFKNYHGLPVTIIHVSSFIWHWLVAYLPLWKMMEFVNWDEMKFPRYGKINFMFQTTNQDIINCTEWKIVTGNLGCIITWSRSKPAFFKGILHTKMQSILGINGLYKLI